MSAADANLPGDSLERYSSDLSLGLAQREEARTIRRRGGLREVDLQFQVQVSGTASAVPVFEEIEIEFDYALHYAPGQRESSLEYPHFTYGSQTNPAVGLHATVVEWLHSEIDGSIIGAVVAIGATGEVPFTGVAHLTFQGLAGRREGLLNE